MAVRKASAVWEGSLQEGTGSFDVASGAVSGTFSAGTRFEENPGTNPEELVGAAHAGCYSMALSATLGRAGFTATRISTTANVNFTRGDDGWAIRSIELNTEAEVPGMDEAAFMEAAEKTKSTCPISKALAAVEITLNAKLVS